jgi:hypothetical protein
VQFVAPRTVVFVQTGPPIHEIVTGTPLAKPLTAKEIPWPTVTLEGLAVKREVTLKPVLATSPPAPSEAEIVCAPAVAYGTWIAQPNVPEEEMVPDGQLEIVAPSNLTV